MSTKQRITIAVFLILALIEFYAEYVQHHELILVIKPILLPLLMLYYTLGVNGKWNKLHKLMLWALFFSWVGDVSLTLTPSSPQDMEVLGVPKNKYFFLSGVGGFLVSHLFFIAAYLQAKGGNTPTLFSRNKVPFAIIALYGIVMSAIVVPRIYANPEKSIAAIPVTIYAAILCSMAAFALNRFGKVNNASFWRVFIGSVIFVISDTMIALNFLAFEGAIPHAGFWIMTTFLAAEYLIADGVLRGVNE